MKITTATKLFLVLCFETCMVHGEKSGSSGVSAPSSSLKTGAEQSKHPFAYQVSKGGEPVPGFLALSTTNPHFDGSKPAATGGGGVINRTRHSKMAVDQFFNVRLLKESKKISSILRKICNVEIGITSMQALYDATPFVMVNSDETAVLERIVSRLKNKLLGYGDMIQQVLDSGNDFQISKSGTNTSASVVDVIPNCQSLPAHAGKLLRMYGTVPVFMGMPCVVTAPNRKIHPDALKFLRGATRGMLKHKKGWNPKWQYAISVELNTDRPTSPVSFVLMEHPGHLIRKHVAHLANRWSAVDRAFSQGRSRNFLLLLDFTDATIKEISKIKEVARALVLFLGPNDNLALLLKSETCENARGGTGTSCAHSKRSFVVDRAVSLKQDLLHFIENFESAIGNSSSSGFDCMWDFFRDRDASQWPVLYIGTDRSQLPMEVAQMVKKFSVAVRRQFELRFALLARNLQPRNIREFTPLDDLIRPSARTVTFVQLADPFPFPHDLISSIIQSSFRYHVGAPSDELCFTELKPDPLSTPSPEMILSLIMLLPASPQTPSHHFFLGGIDIALQDLVEDVLYHPSEQLSSDAYSFILNTDGVTLMHPGMDRQSLQLVSIESLEKTIGFLDIKEVMLSVPKGNLTSPSGRHYAWSRVTGTPFIACVTRERSGEKIQVLNPVSSGEHVDPRELRTLTYHRLELMPFLEQKMCVHKGQLGSSETCGLFLTAGVFNSPFEHLVKEESKLTVQGYLAYFNDQTQLIVNGRFRSPVIKTQVNLLRKICDEWMTRFHTSKQSDMIIRRFAATTIGTMISFPAVQMDPAYNPADQEWYRRARDQPGRIVMTPPQSGSSGPPLITISHSVFDGKPNDIHTSSDKVAVVMGMEVRASYLYQLLVELVPQCQQVALRCFLMDDRGYVVAHQKIDGLGEGQGPQERFHVTHVESVMASDLLNQKKTVIEKRGCTGSDGSVSQRFYKMNASDENVFTSERTCATFAMVAIPGTNVFFVVLAANCTKGERAFCPCSLTDRLCLNCQRVEPTECECPCECPAPETSCDVTDAVEKKSNEVQTCTVGSAVPNEPFVSVVATKTLTQCIHSACIAKKSAELCLKSVQCEWCTAENNRVTRDPFCSLKGRCYGWSFDARYMYLDQSAELNCEESTLPGIFKFFFKLPLTVKNGRRPETITEKSSAVGPIVIGLVALVVVVIISAICICSFRRQDLVLPQLAPSDLGRLDVAYSGVEDDPDRALLHGSGNLGTDYFNPMNQIAEMDVAAPYHANPAYRRPGNWVPAPPSSSDPGYSTMNDSELHSVVGACSAIQSDSSVIGPSTILPLNFPLIAATKLIDLDEDPGNSDKDSNVSGSDVGCINVPCGPTNDTSLLMRYTTQILDNQKLSDRLVAYADIHAS